jgi:hypothetical protein
MKKVAIFAFQGELMCFAHALLNTVDMNEKGIETRLIIEGKATSTISELGNEKAPFAALYKKVKDSGYIAGICKACASKMGTLEEAKKQNLTLLDEMSGHPSYSTWIKEGYEIVSM